MDPISAELTKQVVGGSAQGVAAPKTPNYTTEQSGFSQLLDQQVDANQSATNKLMAFVDDLAGQNSGGSMKAIPADEIKIDIAKAQEIPGGSTTKSSNMLFDIFKQVNNSQNNMDKLLETVSSGKKFSVHEMIKFQVFAHKHTVVYESMSKFIEMGNRALQTPFQMQV